MIWWTREPFFCSLIVHSSILSPSFLCDYLAMHDYLVKLAPCWWRTLFHHAHVQLCVEGGDFIPVSNWRDTISNCAMILYIEINFTYYMETNSVQIMEFNLSYRINIQGERRRGWEGGFAKVWLSNSREGLDSKITQSPMSFEYWFDDSNWCFFSLHEEINLRLMRSLFSHRSRCCE